MYTTDFMRERARELRQDGAASRTPGSTLRRMRALGRRTSISR